MDPSMGPDTHFRTLPAHAAVTDARHTALGTRELAVQGGSVQGAMEFLPQGSDMT
jgi:hypothetical protein